MMSSITTLLLWSCTPVSLYQEPIQTPQTDGPPVDTGEPQTGDTDSTPVEDIAGDPQEESWPQACAEIYNPEQLPTFELDFSASAWAGLQSDCSSGEHPYRPVSFTHNGETIEAMARLKGNWSWTCEKLQFVISFNEEDTGGRFQGLRKIVLDAPWYDHTLLHERLAFPMFAARGLPYSCANNARLMIPFDM